MAYAFYSNNCSLQSASDVSSEDFNAKSIIVKNASSETKKEDLIIHFQRKRNGGGEVECVYMLSEGAAVVTFEKSEVAESVMKRRHKINGFLVTLEQYRQLIPDQVFGKVSGRLDPDTFGVSYSAMKTILQTIQDETEVKWKEIFDGFVVSGTFEQMKRVNDVLKTKLKEKKPQKKLFPPRHVGDSQSRGEHISVRKSKPSTESSKYPTSMSQKSLAKTNQGYSKVKSNASLKESKASANIPIPETRVIYDVLLPESKPPSIETNNIPTVTPENIPARNGKSHERVERNSSLSECDLNANIPGSETQPELVVDSLRLSKTKVSDVANTDANEETQGLDERKQYCDYELLVKSLEHNKRESNGNLYSRCLDQVPKENKSNGDDLQGQRLLEEIKSEEKVSSISPAFGEACTQGQIERHETTECNSDCKTLSDGRKDLGVAGGNHWGFVTLTGVSVMLLKGEITNQHADVLLCPANPTFSYDDGLSKLILDKGGQAIVDDCPRITQNQGPLEEGFTTITAAGNLPCRAILHAVLPPWNNEKEEEKKCKLQIHRCLKQGLALASGFRLRSIALPPLGQVWNKIPVEISAEVIARVVAVFSKSVGPMHSGVNDFRIVCEDDASIDVFVKEFSSFSFDGQKLFFVSVPQKQDSGKNAVALKPHSKIRNNKKGDFKVPKESFVENTQKGTLAAGSDPVVGVDNEDETRISKPAYEFQSSKETTQNNKNTPADHPWEDNDSSFQVNEIARQSQVDQDFSNSRNKSVIPNNEGHACVETISFVPSNSVEHIDVSETTAFEVLQVTSIVQLVEETTKSMVVTNKSLAGENMKTGLVVGDNLKQGQGKEGRAGQITKENGYDIQQPQKPNGGSRYIEIHHHQSNPRDVIDHSPLPTGAHTLNLSSFDHHNNCGLFVTSPTVDDLLNADLRLSFQGLHLWHDKEFDDPSLRSENLKEINEESKGKGNCQLTFGEMDDSSEETSSSKFNTHENPIPNQARTLKMPMPFKETGNKDTANNYWKAEKHAQKDTREYLESGRPISNIAETDNLGEVAKNDEKLNHHKGIIGENYQPESKKERQLSIFCALCQDTVDHPDLTHPNVCVEHKFCDDCILKAFTISSSCPACLDSAGLITIEEEHVNLNRHTQPSSSASSSVQNQDDKTRRPAIPDLNQASQPPGQMMWKAYEASLSGFEGYGTIAVTFSFYDGIQSSEHPNPGRAYRGASFVAYFPDSQEGRQILKQLRKAFDARLVFTVSSSTSDEIGCVSLNGIELKTSLESDSRNGYPDHGYLARVRKQLVEKGIALPSRSTVDNINKRRKDLYL